MIRRISAAICSRIISAVQEALALTREQLVLLARNSIEASFLEPRLKRRWQAGHRRVVAIS